MREGELVREVENQSIINHESEIANLVREVEDQAAITVEKDVVSPTRRYSCWICKNRPFNARHQFVDHVEGAGGGGKSHLKMRKRWIEANQPLREDWLEMLEKTKMKSDESTSFTDATERPSGFTLEPRQDDCSHEVGQVAEWEDGEDQIRNSTLPSPQYLPTRDCIAQQSVYWSQHSMQPRYFMQPMEFEPWLEQNAGRVRSWQWQ